MPGPYSARQVFGSPGLGEVSATVSSLPVGYVLGEERLDGGINYRLCYNAGNSQISVGFMSQRVFGGGGPFSMTVSTVADVNAHVGAVLAHNATVPTGHYYWGAYRGYIASGLIATTITQLAGNASRLSTDGAVLPVTSTAASALVASANMAIAFTVISPTAGTVAVRQASVWLNVP